MFTNPQQEGGLYPNTNPLATQFMTGGQMEYMPNAQFLTSSDYGAFRTTPSYANHTRVQQDPSYWQSYLQANRGRLPGLDMDYLVNTFVPHVNQMKYQAMAQRRFTDANSAIGGVGADVGAGLLGSAVGAALGGPLGALAGGVLMPSVSAPYMDRIKNTRQLQQQSMSKIAFGPDVSTGLRQGFSMAASAGIEEDIIQRGIDDRLFKEEDYRKIQKLGVEAGLFDFAGSEHQYKEALGKITKNFKFLIGMAESPDLKEAFDTMRRLQRMGMGLDMGVTAISSIDTYSRMTGLSHQQMSDTYGQQGALTFSQHGLTGYQGSLEAMSAAARVEMMKRTGQITESQLARRGGVSGMAQDMTQNTASMVGQISDYILPHLANQNEDGTYDHTSLDTEAVRDILQGKTGIKQFMASTGDRMTFGVENYMEYMGNKKEQQRRLMDDLGPEGMQLMAYQIATDIGSQADIKGVKNQAIYGYTKLGMDEEMALEQANFMTDKDNLAELRKQYEQGIRVRKYQQYSLRKEQNTLGKTISRKWNQAMYDIGGRAFASMAYDEALEKDREENEKLDIADTSVYGVSFGEQGYSKEERRQLREGTQLGGFQSEEEYYSQMNDSWFVTDEDAATKYKNMDLFVSSKDFSDEEEQKAIDTIESSDLGLSVLDVADLSAGISDEDDFKGKHLGAKLARTIRKRNKGMSMKESLKAADKFLEDDNVSKFIYSRAANKDEEFYQKIADTMAEKHFELTQESAEKINDQWKAINERMSEQTHQSWGLFDDTETLSALKKATSKSGKSLKVFGAAKAIGSFLSGQKDSDEERAKKRSIVEKQLLAVGMPEEQVNEVLAELDTNDEGGIQKIIQEFMTGSHGVDKDIADAMLRGGFYAGEGKSSQQIGVDINYLDNIERDSARVSAQARKLNVFQKFEKDFREQGYDISEDYANVDVLKEVRDSIEDKGKKEALNAAIKGAESGNINNVADFNASMADHIPNIVSKSITDNLPDTEGAKHQDAIISTFKNLESELKPVLIMVGETMNNVSKVVSSNTEVMKSAQRQRNN